MYVLAPAAAAEWKTMLEMQNLRLYSSPTDSGPPFNKVFPMQETIPIPVHV